MTRSPETQRRRADWPIEVRTLDRQASGRMGDTPAARLRALAVLTAESWRLAGRPTPQYARDEAPIRVVSMRDESPVSS